MREPPQLSVKLLTLMLLGAEAKFKMSFQKRKPFLKELASDYLAKNQKEKPEEAAGDNAKEAADEEEAKAMETEVDAAAEQPKEEAEAGESAADGAIAAPMEDDAKEPAAEAPTAEVSHLCAAHASVCGSIQSCNGQYKLRRASWQLTAPLQCP